MYLYQDKILRQIQIDPESKEVRKIGKKLQLKILQ